MVNRVKNSGKLGAVRSVLFVFGILSGLFSYAKSESKVPLRAAIANSMAAPFLFKDEEKEAQGLIADYTRAIADAMGRKVSVEAFTRFRIDNYLAEGKIDLSCYTSTLWADNQDKLYFSKPFLKRKEVILGPVPMPKKLNQLKGKSIGTILHNFYPSLEPLFVAKDVIREDNFSEEANIQKLINGRINYIVIDDIALNYFAMKNPKLLSSRQTLFLQEYPISCSIRRQGSIQITELNAAIDKIKSNGVLDTILKKYGTL